MHSSMEEKKKNALSAFGFLPQQSDFANLAKAAKADGRGVLESGSTTKKGAVRKISAKGQGKKRKSTASSDAEPDTESSDSAQMADAPPAAAAAADDANDKKNAAVEEPSAKMAKSSQNDDAAAQKLAAKRAENEQWFQTYVWSKMKEEKLWLVYDPNPELGDKGGMKCKVRVRTLLVLRVAVLI